MPFWIHPCTFPSAHFQITAHWLLLCPFQEQSVEWIPAELASWLNTQYPDLKCEARLLQGKLSAYIFWMCSFNWLFCFSFWFLRFFCFFVCYLFIIRHERKRGRRIQVKSGKRKANSAHSVFPHTLFWFLPEWPILY